MAAPRWRFANLDQKQMESLKILEEQLGTYVVALEPQHPIAPLSNEQVEKLQELEKELGVVLIAFKQS